MSRIRPARLTAVLCALAAAFVGTARAEVPPPDIALPEIGGSTEEKKEKSATGEPVPEVESEIDLANIVTSAAKGVTTVQEAPTIVTIVTADEIRSKGFRTIGQVLGTVPGWIDITGEGDQVQLPMVRGAVQAALYLRDGVSMFDPFLNIASLTRALPLEAVKRVEVVTGPGGVLWGANSFLGIVNVITKDAEDVNGFEFNAGYGDGKGDRSDARVYGMFGKAFFNNKLKIFLHASYENFGGPEFTLRQLVATAPAPQPTGPAIYANDFATSQNDRSWLLNLDGKLTVGPVTAYFNLPFGTVNHSLSFPGAPIVPAKDFSGSSQNAWRFYDRYGILEYKDRFFRDKIGLNAKAFYIQFVRDLNPRVFPSSGALPGGLTFAVNDLNVQRFGGTIDADFAGPFTWNRVLIGAEAFNERIGTAHTQFPAPTKMGNSDPSLLPVICPVKSYDPMAMTAGYVDQCPLVFINAAERTVIGVFIDDQIRPFQSLTLDGGVRYQQGFGPNHYDPQILASGAAVWQFIPNFHLKLNIAQGFRPPVFNNTNSNGYAVEFAGNPHLEVERSTAYQTEVNARVLKNTRRIRELQLRIDYSYTLLDKMIIIQNQQYANSGKRAVHSVEFLSKLYLQGDHNITVGYTFLKVATSDAGELRTVPNHWFTIGAVFNLIKDTLDVNGNLNVFGAYEDPNRVAVGTISVPGATNLPYAPLSALAFDRLTPVAQLQLGARLRLWKEHIGASVQFYNVLNQHYYYPDVFNDLAAPIELKPNPAPGFSFFASVTYRP